MAAYLLSLDKEGRTPDLRWLDEDGCAVVHRVAAAGDVPLLEHLLLVCGLGGLYICVCRCVSGGYVCVEDRRRPRRPRRPDRPSNPEQFTHHQQQVKRTGTAERKAQFDVDGPCLCYGWTPLHYAAGAFVVLSRLVHVCKATSP